MGDVAQILGITPRNDDIDVLNLTASAKKLPRAVKLQRLPKDVLDLVAGSNNNETSMELPTAVPAISLFSSSAKRNLTNTAVGNTTAGSISTSGGGGGDTVVKVGQKWISTSKPARSWKWSPFTSSARNDGLVLHHWVRNNIEYLDYPYARFNIHLDTVSYNNDAMHEYRALQLHTDPNWSKSETDLLLELARRYELRWPVIYDRWIEVFSCRGSINESDADDDVVAMTNPDSGNRFQIEDLQHRYYTVAALINQSRITTEAEYEARSLVLQTNAASAALANITASGSSSSGSISKTIATPATDGATPPTNTTTGTTNNTNTNVGNDTESEITKQRAVETLLIETAAARALATTEPQYQPLIQNIGSGTSNKMVFDLQKERERRLQMEAIWNRSKEEELEEIELRKELKQIEVQLRKLKKSGAHIAAAATSSTGIVNNVSATASQISSRASTPIQLGRSGVSGGVPREAVAVDVATLPATLDQAFSTTTTGPIAMAGTPYLQSCRLLPPGVGDGATINQALLSRMDTVLDELNIPQNPIPTKRVCDLYDTLRKDILTLLILQKDVLQKEGILATKHLHLAKKSGNTNVDDEETLLGIPPPKPPTPALRAPASAATASSAGGKGSRNTKTGRVDGPRKKVTTPKAGADTKKEDAGLSNPTKPASGGKQPRKPSVPGTKRKRKSDESGPKPVVSNVAAPAATLSATVVTAAKPSIVPGTASTTIPSGIITNATGLKTTTNAVTKPITPAELKVDAGSVSTTAAAVSTSAAVTATTTPTDSKASAKKRAKKSNS